MSADAHVTLKWLLAGDPAIRWQALRDLAGADEAVYAAERKRVAEGRSGCWTN